ncbi:hypothetical protein MAUB1S_09664 [Mycolicibacterium aubagnense]
MTIFEVVSTVSHRSLMNKSKDDLARWIMHLLDCRDESEQARVQRVTDLLEANNRYQQEGRDARAQLKARFDLSAHLAHQRAWSAKTFGPGPRTKGVLDHIRKELTEIEADPADLKEWVDVIILAFDGAWRAGWEPEAIVAAIVDKQARNEKRQWPDWRTADPDKAIEHVRHGRDQEAGSAAQAMPEGTPCGCASSQDQVAVSISELVERGMDERLRQVIEAAVGDCLPDGSKDRITREEAWAIGYGEPCPCGERGMAPWEIDKGDMCADCREAQGGSDD